jgi:hypothetical protein
MSAIGNANFVPTKKTRAVKIRERQQFHRKQRRERKEKDKIRTQFRAKQHNIKYGSSYYSSDDETDDFGEFANYFDDGATSTVTRGDHPQGYGLYCIYCAYCSHDYGEIAYVVCSRENTHYCKRCQSVLESRLAILHYGELFANDRSQNQQQFYETVLAKNPFYIHE